jgi:oxalate decarboxylase
VILVRGKAEWAYMLAGSACVTGLDTKGGNYIGDVSKGDLWDFPAGYLHSI